jgi:hypothetical protein
MAVAILVDTPNMASEQYDALMAEMGTLPEACKFHVAGVGPDGSWRVVTVWEDAEKAQAFMASTLRPSMEKVGITPSGSPPQIWTAHRVIA